MKAVCRDTQVALEKLHHVALDNREQELVDEHLPGCQDCLAFATTLEEMEKVMEARAEVLNREVDFTALAASARASLRKQKRSMARGLIGLAAIAAIAIAVSLATGDAEVLWPLLMLAALAGYALVGDLARLRLTRRWAMEPPRLTAPGARRERRLAIAKLVGFAALAVIPLPWSGVAFEIADAVLGLVGLVGAFHYVFVTITLTREIRALRG